MLVLARTDSRSLFDIVQTLLRTAGDEGSKSRAVPDKEVKAGALYVAGEIFARLGHNVMSLFNELLALTQRLFKNANAPVLVRFHALLCLSKALASGARSLNDQPAKELLRNLRTGLGDRAGAVVRGCAEVGEQERPTHAELTRLFHSVSWRSRSRATSSPRASRSRRCSLPRSRP